MSGMNPSGAAVGSGRGGRGVPQGGGSLQPVKVNVEKIGAWDESVGNLFREAEDSVVALRSAETARDSLYEAPEQELADKFGIGGER